MKLRIPQAKSITCLGNNKQIAQAFTVWSDDNAGYVPPITWQSRMQDYGIAWKIGVGPKIAGILRCPDDLSTYWKGDRSSVSNYSGYAINLQLNWPFESPGGRGDGVSPWGTGNIYYNVHGNCKLSQVRKPSTYVYTMDATSYSNANPQDANFYNNFRHLRMTKANVAWMDGHASLAPNDIGTPSNTGAPTFHTYYKYFYP